MRLMVAAILHRQVQIWVATKLTAQDLIIS
jgi:hypothetical protein